MIEEDNLIAIFDLKLSQQVQATIMYVHILNTFPSNLDRFGLQ